MHYTIYKVTNKINGKIYIGSHKTKNLDDGYMGSGKYLKRAMKKYGIENFEKQILFVYDNPEAMFKKEKELVNEDFLAIENTYNLKVGGSGGWDYINQNDLSGGGWRKSSSEEKSKSGRIGGIATFNKKVGFFSAESKNKAKKTLLEKYPNGTFYGKTHSEETKKIISQQNSIMQSGEKNSQYGTMWITNGIKNAKIKRNDTIPDGWQKGRK